MSKALILLIFLCGLAVLTQANIIFEPEALPPAGHHAGYLPHHPPTMAPAPHHHHHHRHPHHHSPSPSPANPPSHVTPVYPPPVHTPTHSPAQPPSHVPVHPPAKPPTYPYPPKQAPVKPPVQPPAHPPFHPLTRSFVAVQGVVYCKSCRYSGVDTFLGALPILGATVKLQCNSTKYPVVATGKTDKNGYFFMEAPKTITSYGFHKCKVSLVSSPQTQCSKPSNLHDGLVGAILRPAKSYFSNKLPFVLYTVGPFAFEPSCPR